MTTQNEVIRALRDFAHEAVFAGWRKMLTGRRTETNTITLAGAPAGKTWVRAHDASREQTAVWGFVGIPNVTVWVAPGVDGENRITALDYAESVQAHGNKVLLAQQPPLDGNLNAVLISGQNFQPGRLRAYAESGSMLVYVEPFAHANGRFEGGPIDLTGETPATSGTNAWVAVATDPETNTLHAYQGIESYDSASNLDPADAYAIAIPSGYYRNGAVALNSDTTEITPGTRIIDLRSYLSAVGYPALDSLSNVDTTGKADGETLVWDAGTSEWVPATPSLSTIDNIGDVDTSSTPPTDGQALIWNDSTNLWVPGSAGGGGGGSGAAAFGVGVTKTLSSDVAAAGTDRHLILAAESGTVDDCIEITGLSNGDEVIVRADAGDTITLKHNAAGATDKILLYAGADFALSGDKTMKLVKIASGKVVQYVDDKGLGGGADYILIRDEKSSGTNGGTFTSGAWRTRDLNTEISDAGNHASVSGNQITLAAGTYQARIICPAYGVNTNQARLYDITNSAVLLLGQNNYGTTGNGSTSLVVGKFTLAGSTVVEVQHRCSWTANTNGFGVAGSWGTEVYTVAEFWKVG